MKTQILKTKNWLIYKIADKALHKAIKKYASGRLIDIGCGEKPYTDIMIPYITEHIGVDHENSQHDKSNIDLFGTVYGIPVDDESLDSAICTTVLEYLEEPDKTINEVKRVLKKGWICNLHSSFILVFFTKSQAIFTDIPNIV